MLDPLDAIDRRILGVLQKDSRVTNAELSERVNLSPSACHRRVQRLEQDGFIAAYVALLDARKMGKPTIVFVEITLQSQAEDLLDAFEREVAKVPDILECHLMAGSADYLIKIMAEDTEDFARIHRRFLSRLPGCGRCSRLLRCARWCRRRHWRFRCHTPVTTIRYFPNYGYAPRPCRL